MSNLDLLKQGWTLNVWRMTTPWNYWIESPSGEQEELDRLDYLDLRRYCTPGRNSRDKVPWTPLSPDEAGMPMQTVYRFSARAEKAALAADHSYGEHRG